MRFIGANDRAMDALTGDMGKGIEAYKDSAVLVAQAVFSSLNSFEWH